MKNIFLYIKKLSENKSLEIQIALLEFYIKSIYIIFNIFSNTCYFRLYLDFIFFNIDINWSRKTDHAGFNFNFQLFGFYFNSQIHDHRHWDDENNCWYVYN